MSTQVLEKNCFYDEILLELSPETENEAIAGRGKWRRRKPLSVMEMKMERMKR